MKESHLYKKFEQSALTALTNISELAVQDYKLFCHHIGEELVDRICTMSWI